MRCTIMIPKQIIRRPAVLIGIFFFFFCFCFWLVFPAVSIQVTETAAAGSRYNYCRRRRSAVLTVRCDRRRCLRRRPLRTLAPGAATCTPGCTVCPGTSGSSAASTQSSSVPYATKSPSTSTTYYCT